MNLALAFAQTIERMHLRLGGEPDPSGALSAQTVKLWQAAADGHACVAIDEPGLHALLRASPVVSYRPAADRRTDSPGCPRPDPVDGPDGGSTGAPLVLDGATLYLERLWRAESELARKLVALDASAPLAAPGAIAAVLDQVAPAAQVDPRQREAIAAGLGRRLAIVTGGPGTGKTSTMARLLVAVCRLDPSVRVAIAAPTGKAAARLAQALASQLAVLDPRGELARQLPSSGTTVHRLLGLREPAGEGSPRSGQMPRYGLVIVDEASMLDLELARALVDSIPPTGRLVLAGDRDQLASVEAGAVFAEICASELGGVVRLERNYRQAAAPALGALAAWLRDRCLAADEADGADGAEAAAAPFDPGAGVERHAPRGAAAIADQALAAWAPALQGIGDGAGPLPIRAAFDAHRVLCAMREGPLGVAAINAAVAARIRRRFDSPAAAIWYPGRVVIVTRNRPELGLFNGDVGVCLPMRDDPDDATGSTGWTGSTAGAGDGSAGDLAVAFDAGAGELRWVALRRMPAHDDAFAITVHKSQGSEFDSVALVPAPRGHRLNTRELLYTGATRARHRLGVWAEAEALDEGAMRRSARHGRLADRIAGLRASSAKAGE